MDQKRWTLLAAIAGTLTTALLAIGGVLPAKWTALTAALGAGTYAIMRALQKRAAGATWKSLLSTTEAWGAGLAIVAVIVGAASGVLPVEWAAGTATLAAVLLRVARALQAQLPDGPKAPTGAAPCWLVFFVGAAVLLSALAGRAHAASPSQLGGCVGNVCVNPSLLVPAVVRLDLSKQAFELVPALGGCYGVAYRQDAWWSFGADLCLAVQLSKDSPNAVTPALLLKFMGARLGADLRLTQQSGAPLDKSVGLLFTYGFDFGGSPAYVQQAGGAP